MEARDPHPPKLPPRGPKWPGLFYYVLAMLGFFWLWQIAVSRNLYREISYAQFKDYLRQGAVTNAVIKSATIEGVIKTNAPAGTGSAVESNNVASGRTAVTNHAAGTKGEEP